ncbi:MAG: hypothetical protein ABIB71_05680 [Candidatus Woesearchaeota archaeon]
MAEKKRVVKDRSLRTIVRDMVITGVITLPLTGGIEYLLNDNTFMENLTSYDTISHTAVWMIGIGFCRLVTGVGIFNRYEKYK